MSTKPTIKPTAKKPVQIKPKIRIGGTPKPPAEEAAPLKKAAAAEVAAPTPQKVVAPTLSLIDAKPKRATRVPVESTKKPFAHIPISRILAPEAPKVIPPPVVAEPELPPEPVSLSIPDEEPSVDTTNEDITPVNPKIIHLKPPFTVKDLAAAIGIPAFKVIGDLMEWNIFASINQNLESDVASKVCTKHDFIFEKESRKTGGGVHKPAPAKAPKKTVELPPPSEMQHRAPIVTFMGHVDHGKTTLMDAIRKTRVASGEAGGITQHIGAYSVTHKDHKITFLDTPGHAAFTAMRARGASVTDIVVLVVAADDGIMPQTTEAINHAKAAKVAIIVAITKIDTPGANLDKVKGQLQEKGLVPEEWGGTIGVCPVAALKGKGVDELLERIQLEAELLELKASEHQSPRGSVIEAQVEQGRGPTATIIVKSGTLKVGLAFICGKFHGKVKSLINDLGKPIKEAGPSTPCRVLGFSGLPYAGDELVILESERAAQALGEERIAEERLGKLATPQRATLESLFDTLKEGQKKKLNIVLKSDVQGSLEAIINALGEIQSKKIDLHFIHEAVGPITENDILLATAAHAVVVGFNVKTESTAANIARREGVQIKLFSIIYELIDQVKEAMAGMLDPETREAVIGHAEVKKVFELTKGLVAGCAVTDGRISRSARARVLRGRQPIYDGGLATLRRFQDDVKEVRSGLECGIKLGDFNDYEPGDIIECYTLEKLPQKL